MDFLPGDGGDAVVVFVVVQHRDVGGFGRGSDQQVGVTDRTVMQAAFVGELLIDLERSLPLFGTDRAARYRVELAT